jgi:ankyrin repeat protein
VVEMAGTAALTIFYFLSLNQNYNIVKFLLDHGVDVNAANNNNMTPLFFTLHNENIIKLLFDHHADMNHKDSNNDTPLGAWTKNLKQDGQQFEAAHQMLLACGATL